MVIEICVKYLGGRSWFWVTDVCVPSTETPFTEKRVISESPAMKSYIVIRCALWSRPLISDCLFSVATTTSFAPLPRPSPPLINLIF
jgi:hypothetical protein